MSRPPETDVEARELLGEHQRIALRQHDDPGREADARGPRGQEGKRDERVEDRVERLHRRRGHARVRHHDVLAGPDRVVPELLGQRPDPLEDLAAGVAVEREQPERRSGAHAGCACAQLSISRDPLITSSSSVTSTGTQLCPESRFTSRRPGVWRKPGHCSEAVGPRDLRVVPRVPQRVVGARAGVAMGAGRVPGGPADVELHATRLATLAVMRCAATATRSAALPVAGSSPSCCAIARASKNPS